MSRGSVDDPLRTARPSPSGGWKRWRRRVPVFLLVSVLVHAVLFASLPDKLPSVPDLVEVVFQTVAGGPARSGGNAAARADSAGERARPAPSPQVRLPVLSRSLTESALDHGVPGVGASSGGAVSLLLADRDWDITVAEHMPNHPSVSQFQRIRTASDRSSFIDDRLTPNPAEATTLTSGHGRAHEQLRARGRIGIAGTTAHPLASASTPAPAEPAPPLVTGDGAAAPPPPPDAAPSGTEETIPLAEGVANGSRAGAPLDGTAVGFTRPELHHGRPAVPSQEREGRLRDNRWSELLVSTLRTGWTSASDPGGASGSERGAAEGGQGAGRRGDGHGGRSVAAGAIGDETWISLNSPDPRFMDFFRDIHRKVDPLWRNAFPHDAAISLEQGTCIIGFTVHRSGRVTGVHIRRRSGFPEFDRRVQDAIRRAAPFSPIPTSLGVDRLLVTAPFEFSNPMFR